MFPYVSSDNGEKRGNTVHKKTALKVKVHNEGSRAMGKRLLAIALPSGREPGKQKKGPRKSMTLKIIARKRAKGQRVLPRGQ